MCLYHLPPLSHQTLTFRREWIKVPEHRWGWWVRGRSLNSLLSGDCLGAYGVQDCMHSVVLLFLPYSLLSVSPVSVSYRLLSCHSLIWHNRTHLLLLLKQLPTFPITANLYYSYQSRLSLTTSSYQFLPLLPVSPSPTCLPLPSLLTSHASVLVCQCTPLHFCFFCFQCHIPFTADHLADRCFDYLLQSYFSWHSETCRPCFIKLPVLECKDWLKLSWMFLWALVARKGWGKIRLTWYWLFPSTIDIKNNASST